MNSQDVTNRLAILNELLKTCAGDFKMEEAIKKKIISLLNFG